ncbi:MAG: SUMF1/EgtB/PvdO family nonheme iron enzyme, partial [Polyangiaceae bacterium]|nr:SUMF1/EgtB/PvdO family nonheme iron enzyme [Polyangiaceae bacterium]
MKIVELVAISAVVFSVFGCVGTSVQVSGTVQTPKNADERPAVQLPEAEEAAKPDPVAVAPAEAPEPAGPSACPNGMKLVEGDYCTKVQQNCLKSWFDESNKKKVCEKFEEKTTCVGDRVKKRYCVDEFEYPNVKNHRPQVMNNFYQAQVKCAAQGKRMCTESEWTFACEGPEMKPFPHGYVRDATKCRGDQKWVTPNMKKVAKRDPVEIERLWQGVDSGTQPDCISDFGVADMPGNADEVAASETYGGWKGKFDSVTTGGPPNKGVRNQC